MTYCLAIALKEGLVFASDSRTNAGVDQVSTYSKMQTFGIPGLRQFVLLCAGNLATTQSVVAQLERDIRERASECLMTVRDLPEAANYLGRVSVREQHKVTGGGFTYEASFILGGQIGNSNPMIVLVYPQGNYITTSEDTPFLQIGESKYGKPILDRIITPTTNLETAAVCALVSMDSTIRSNITVGPPVELVVYRSNSLCLDERIRLSEDNQYLRELKIRWDEKIKEAFRQLPPINWKMNRLTDIDSRNTVA